MQLLRPECSLSTLTAALHTPTCGPQSTRGEWSADAIDSPAEDEGSESCLGEQISKIWPVEWNAEHRGEARPSSFGFTGLENQVPGLFQKKKEENKRSYNHQVTWRLQLRWNALGTFRGAYLFSKDLELKKYTYVLETPPNRSVWCLHGDSPFLRMSKKT